MSKYVLGTVEASEQLIKDLYIDLRNKVNAWSKITFQTPQARMGYIGQHLASVVTGYHGGKSGARGHDLIMGKEEYGEIKTCYRVDQLGKCGDCGAAVSSLEKECSSCGSKNIIRRNDSKWLIGIRHDQELAEIADPKSYYFVLFENDDITEHRNDNIIASIWEVNPKCKGFMYCMIDYYFNIHAKSKSNAPFDMWPHHIKFALTNPKLIYRSIIHSDGRIETKIFPTLHNGYIDELPPLPSYASATTLTIGAIASAIKKISPRTSVKGSKRDLLNRLEKLRNDNKIPNQSLCDMLADAIYDQKIAPHSAKISGHLLTYYNQVHAK